MRRGEERPETGEFPVLRLGVAFFRARFGNRFVAEFRVNLAGRVTLGAAVADVAVKLVLAS